MSGAGTAFWLEFFKASLGPAVALIAVVIGYWQWKTAHQKVVLDLFDRRIRVYEAAQAAVKAFLTKDSTFRQLRDFENAQGAALFLLGREVILHMEKFHELASKYIEVQRRLDDCDDPDIRKKISSESFTVLDVMLKWADELPVICEPYMNMDQKLIRSPLEWARSRF